MAEAAAGADALDDGVDGEAQQAGPAEAGTTDPAAGEAAGETGSGEAGASEAISASDVPLVSSETPASAGEAAPESPPDPPAVAPAAADACAAKVRVQNPVIADFEGYDGTIDPAQFTFYFGIPTPNAGALGGLFSFDDLTGTSKRLGILAGRNGGWGASFQIVQATEWGGGTGLWFSCLDASAYSGISFWVRGETATGAFSVTAGFQQTTPVNAENPGDGGSCTGGEEGCASPALDAVPLTLDWTLIEIPWTAFTPGLADGQPFVPTGDELTGITFGLPVAWGPDPDFVDNPNDTTDMPEFFPLPSDIILQFDDVRFME